MDELDMALVAKVAGQQRDITAAIKALAGALHDLAVHSEQLEALLAVDPEHVVFEYPDGWACRCWLCGYLGVGLVTRQAALDELRDHECDPDLTDSSPKAGGAS